MTTNLDQTLLERACRYGAFVDVAQRSNNIQVAILHNAPQFSSLTPLYREALHMIAYKLARLMNGQINDLDSWHDIAGYAMLVHNQIAAEQEEKGENSAPSPIFNKPEPVGLDAMETQIAQDLNAEQA